MNLIPLEKCVKGRVYKLDCRNFNYGVYNGKYGFIGIRRKFNDRFLFTEYHKDIDPHYGTVIRMEDMGIDVPDDIELKEDEPTIDRNTGRHVWFDKPVVDGGRGWVYKDTDENSYDIKPVSHVNRKLFKFLDDMWEDFNYTEVE